MHQTATRSVALVAASGTLVLMAYAARPAGDSYGYQGIWGYIPLLFLAVWATLPYLVLVIMAKRSVPAKTNKILFLIGVVIISFGGIVAYMEAIWLNPDPQAGLAFIAVPFYQWVILGLLAGLQWLAKKYEKRM